MGSRFIIAILTIIISGLKFVINMLTIGISFITKKEIPMVDDLGIDAIVRRYTGSFLEIQIKAQTELKKNN